MYVECGDHSFGWGTPKQLASGNVLRSNGKWTIKFDYFPFEDVNFRLQIVELPEGTGRGSLFTWQMADSLGINFAQVMMSEWIQKSLDCFFWGLNFGWEGSWSYNILY